MEWIKVIIRLIRDMIAATIGYKVAKDAAEKEMVEKENKVRKIEKEIDRKVVSRSEVYDEDNW